MRESIILGAIIGAFFFAAGGALTALAIKYSTSSMLWDFVLWGGIGMMVGSILTLALYISSQIGGRPFMWPAILANLAICCASLASVLHFSSQGEKSSADAGLFIECNNAPPTIKTPTDKRIYMLHLWSVPTDQVSGGLGIMTVPQNNFTVVDFDLGGPPIAYECKVTNYDNATAFDVEIGLLVRFQEAINEPDGVRKGGKVTFDGKWPITITKVDPGPNNSFVFYAVNLTREFVQVSFPATANIKRLTDQTAHQVPLTSPHKYAIMFPPIIEKSAPPKAAKSAPK